MKIAEPLAPTPLTTNAGTTALVGLSSFRLPGVVEPQFMNQAYNLEFNERKSSFEGGAVF